MLLGLLTLWNGKVAAAEFPALLQSYPMALVVAPTRYPRLVIVVESLNSRRFFGGQALNIYAPSDPKTEASYPKVTHKSLIFVSKMMPKQRGWVDACFSMVNLEVPKHDLLSKTGNKRKPDGWILDPDRINFPTDLNPKGKKTILTTDLVAYIKTRLPKVQP